MEWLPTARAALLRLALPVASSGAFPKAAPSAVKVTVPVGMPPLPATFADKVTGESTMAGLALEVTVAEVVAMSTCRGSGMDRAPPEFTSPEYVAMMDWTPGAKMGLTVAEPEVTGWEPIATPPLVKAMVPVGVATP
jgi:hypothetical protein